MGARRTNTNFENIESANHIHTSVYRVVKTRFHSHEKNGATMIVAPLRYSAWDHQQPLLSKTYYSIGGGFIVEE
ncbi:serine dehydratase beta chain, partial [Klebsiella aerogenes]|uniref:serine dehydratase beta chain n=1 Tax=Klebsiella aerogenes TaxID=548 RepID=UPI0018C8C37A